MKRTSELTGTMLVSAAFIILVILSMSAVGQISENQLKIKNSETGVLRIGAGDVIFPWADKNTYFRLARHPDYIPRSQLITNERINTNDSNPDIAVSDLKAFNGNAKRDLILDQTQNCDWDAENPANSMDINIHGKLDEKKDWPMDELDEKDIEKTVDNAIDQKRTNDGIRDATTKKPPENVLGNNMNIQVSGITVSAINTVQGGSAIATSNIIIKPVQIIVCPTEVDEKLK